MWRADLEITNSHAFRRASIYGTGPLGSPVDVLRVHRRRCSRGMGGPPAGPTGVSAGRAFLNCNTVLGYYPHALLDLGDATGGWEALELEGIVAGDDAFFGAGDLHHAFLRLHVGRPIGLCHRGARGTRIEIAVK